jgi:hypothetical protein
MGRAGQRSGRPDREASRRRLEDRIVGRPVFGAVQVFEMQGPAPALLGGDPVDLIAGLASSGSIRCPLLPLSPCSGGSIAKKRPALVRLTRLNESVTPASGSWAP